VKYDNMKTAVDKVWAGKQRTVHARLEAEFRNRASGWEKGIVEKSVHNRHRGIRPCG